MDVKGSIIQKERKKEGLSQQQLANQIGIDRTTLSKYVNGRSRIPDHILESIANILDSPIIQIMVRGTTVNNIIFDQIHTDFYVSAQKYLEEMEELKEKIQEVMRFAYNLESIDDLSEEQLEKFNEMLDENEDVNHCSDIFDISCHELGADLKERNKRRPNYYTKKGYVSKSQIAL